MNTNNLVSKFTSAVLASFLAAATATAAPVVSVEPDVDGFRLVVVDTAIDIVDLDVSLSFDNAPIDLGDAEIQKFGKHGLVLDVTGIESPGLLMVDMASASGRFTHGEWVAPLESSAKGGVNWVSIWRKAVRLAKIGTPNGVVKAFLSRHGYICPSLAPWFLCARPAG